MEYSHYKVCFILGIQENITTPSMLVAIPKQVSNNTFSFKY